MTREDSVISTKEVVWWVEVFPRGMSGRQKALDEDRDKSVLIGSVNKSVGD